MLISGFHQEIYGDISLWQWCEESETKDKDDIYNHFQIMDDDNDKSFESIVIKDEDIFTDNSYDNDPEPVLSGNITDNANCDLSFESITVKDGWRYPRVFCWQWQFDFWFDYKVIVGD